MSLASPRLVLLLLLPSIVFCCQSLHSKSHGVEIVCCSSSALLPSNCEFSSLCSSECNCRLLLTDSLECSPSNSLFEWKDHASSSGNLSCDHPLIPNKEAPYHLFINGWNNLTNRFLNGLCGTKVTKFVLELASSPVSFPDFGSCFPSIESIDISIGKRVAIDIRRVLGSLSNLRNLRFVGVDFDFPNVTPSWASSLEYVNVENSSLSELPKWLSLAKNLTKIVLKHTSLSSISTVAQMRNLRSARLSHNRIDDLHRLVLSTPTLFDLDLSHNKISSLASFTFSKCTELRVLDLSQNPILHLPFRPFLKTQKLKWLKMEGTLLKSLTTDHFVGLTSLRTLSLSHTPLHSVAPFSLLPLKNLRSLDLQACNLTRIPVAVTQNCALSHLNLANNLLHRGNSLPPEVLALLSSLSQFRIDGNPLTEFPPSLLLLSPDNVKLYRQVVLTTTQLPMWTMEPCSPYFWNMHLRNRSLSLRQLVSSWDENRMIREGLNHCREQFEWISEQMAIYRDLERSSGCSMSRRLRSAIQKVSFCNSSSTASIPLSVVSHSPVSVTRLSAHSTSTPIILLFVSLAANVFFVLLIIIFICLISQCGRKPKY